MSSVMRREPVEIPRKPGVFALINSKSQRCGYVAYATDLQKRSHSFAHMLAHPKTHWSIRDLPHAPADEWVFTLIGTTASRARGDRLIAHTKDQLRLSKYRVIEGDRSARPTVLYPSSPSEALSLAEAIRRAKCKRAYITVWRRLDRGWTVAQALDLEDPPPRWEHQR